MGDSNLELEFSNFLDNCPDVISYAKNYFSINFKLDYVNKEGGISNYYPDFIVKLQDKRIFIVETKGLEDLDVPLKMHRLANWCNDVNNIENIKFKFDYLFIDQDTFEKFEFQNFVKLIEIFTKFK